MAAGTDAPVHALDGVRLSAFAYNKLDNYICLAEMVTVAPRG